MCNCVQETESSQEKGVMHGWLRIGCRAPFLARFAFTGKHNLRDGSQCACSRSAVAWPRACVPAAKEVYFEA